jgi:hypothetical protein
LTTVIWNLLLGVIVSHPVGVLASDRAVAQGGAAREAAEQALRLLGRASLREGEEALTRRLERLAVKHGDDVFRAAMKVGPEAIRLIESAGAHGEVVAKLLGRYGDRAVWVVGKPTRLALISRHGEQAALALVRHRTLAEPFTEGFGAAAARALARVSSRNARRMAILLADGTLKQIGRTKEVLGVIGRFGDPAMEFVWRHKGALAVGTVLGAFLADPEPFLDGARDLVSVAAGTIVRPAIELPKEIIRELVPSTGWGWIVMLGVAGLLLYAGYLRLRARFRKR